MRVAFLLVVGLACRDSDPQSPAPPPVAPVTTPVDAAPLADADPITDVPDVGTLVEHCEAYNGKALRVRGSVESVSICPSCPKGAMCKPCFGDYFVLGGNGKQIAVSALRDRMPAVSSAIVEIVGHVWWSPGSYAVNPCMMRVP
jgi:hypothetical protein